MPIARQSDSWSLYWNFDQYLYVDPCDEKKGWGVFGRAGIADNRTNPISLFLSFGVGGNSKLPGREADTFGAGWYYSRVSEEISPFLTIPLGNLNDSGQGVELFYNIEVTKQFHLTADIQVIDSAQQSIDTALLTGVRAVIAF